MIYAKRCKYRLQGFVAYRVDNTQRRRARGCKRALWMQQGDGPWKLRSLYDGGVRRLGWEMDAMMSGRARHFAGRLVDQITNHAANLSDELSQARRRIAELEGKS